MNYLALAERFGLFGGREGVDLSPFYIQLSLGIAEDTKVLALADLVPSGQPPPNLLFGAVLI